MQLGPGCEVETKQIHFRAPISYVGNEVVNDSSSRSEQDCQFEYNASPFLLHLQPCTLGQFLDARLAAKDSSGNGYGKEV